MNMYMYSVEESCSIVRVVLGACAHMSRRFVCSCLSYVDARVALEGLRVVHAEQRAHRAAGAELEGARQRERGPRAQDGAQAGALAVETLEVAAAVHGVAQVGRRVRRVEHVGHHLPLDRVPRLR